jgi:hypothetical protein
VERNDAWARIIAAAGAVGAAVALIYVIGGASLSLRYEGFGLPGQQAAALTPREALLAAGLRTLLVWAGLGFLLVLALRAHPDAVRAVAERLRPRSSAAAGLLVALVLLVVLLLLLVLNVWWPLAAFGAVLAISLSSVHWESRPVRRMLVSAISIALVAVAYEVDRLSYLVEWTCVSHGTQTTGGGVAVRSSPPRAQQRVCGILIGQQDRGFYLGVPGKGDDPVAETGPYRLVFIPAERVVGASSRKQSARVIASRAEARRESPLSRLIDIRVR